MASSVQQVLFDFDGLLNPPVKKRIRYKIPTYKKFYSVIRYDREKFRKLLNLQLKGYLCTKPLTQSEILEQCYIRDPVSNAVIYDSDEHHIFRYGTLQNIYEKIYNYLDVNIFDYSTFKPIKNLNVYHDEKQAEISNTWDLPLFKRVKIHIKLLKYLKQGLDIEKAVRLTLWQTQKI